MSVRVERLGPDDWPRQRELRLAALDADPDAFYRSLAEEVDLDENRWRERLSGPAATWVAVVDGSDAGLVACLPDSHEGLPELVSLWVSPSARGHRVAGLLVEAAADFARSIDASELRLWLADSNAAGLALYDRLGATPTGRTGHFPPPREHLTEHERSLSL
ncbi:MAG TPA: GNAT family N-acetyltransferase [Actinomycetales bacterium]|nr:GNAT family N-acetyltransferase [Actinomycetales bacterium]